MGSIRYAQINKLQTPDEVGAHLSKSAPRIPLPTEVESTPTRCHNGFIFQAMVLKNKGGHDSPEEAAGLRSQIARFERELESMGEKVASQTVSILIDDEELRRDVATLERRMSQVEEQTREMVQLLKSAQPDPNHPGSEDSQEGGAGLGGHFMLGQLKALRDRIKQMETENRSLTSLCEQLREQNEAVSNLYVAKHRLHATFDPNEVIKITVEILVELVGAEEFGILLLDQKRETVRLVAGQGVENRIPGKSLPAGEGIIGDVIRSGKPFFFEPNDPLETEAPLPIATIPLNMNENTIGVVVIYRLFVHKKGFSPIDHQLLDLVAEHAPSALLSAHLYRKSTERSPLSKT